MRFFAMAIICSGLSAQVQQTAEIELRSYSAYGKPLPVEIAGLELVKLGWQNSNRWFYLDRTPNTATPEVVTARQKLAKSMRIDGNRATGLIPGEYRLILKRGDRTERYGLIQVRAGRQRVAFSDRAIGQIEDTEAAWPVQGRLQGCAWTGDWWVQAIPLYESGSIGVNSSGSRVEGDGRFEVLIFFGIRYVLVFGKGNQVIQSFTTTDPRKPLGTYKITQACPGGYP